MESGVAGQLPDAFRWSNLVVLTTGAFSAALGLLVLFGWHTHNETLLQLHPTLIAMVYNTALSFFVCGVGLLALASRRARLALACGIGAAALGFGNLIENGLGVDLG